MKDCDSAKPDGPYLRGLRISRVLLVGLAAEPFATAPGIKKSSSSLPPLIAAASQRGLRPRPAQVSAGFSGLRYLGATGPIRPPRASLVAFPPPPKPASFRQLGFELAAWLGYLGGDGRLDLAFQGLQLGDGHRLEGHGRFLPVLRAYHS
jgi:hypothetical protein